MLNVQYSRVQRLNGNGEGELLDGGNAAQEQQRCKHTGPNSRRVSREERPEETVESCHSSAGQSVFPRNNEAHTCQCPEANKSAKPQVHILHHEEIVVACTQPIT